MSPRSPRPPTRSTMPTPRYLKQLRNRKLLKKKWQPKASCEGLATDGKLAGPKTTTIFDELNALNTGSLEYWVGLDDRWLDLSSSQITMDLSSQTTLKVEFADSVMACCGRHCRTCFVLLLTSFAIFLTAQRREHTRSPTEPASRWREGRSGRRTRRGAPTSPPGRTGSPRTMSTSRRSRTVSRYCLPTSCQQHVICIEGLCFFDASSLS